MKATLSLRDRCLALAEAYAWEINGDLDQVEQEAIDSILADLTPENLEETAGELAHLAAWMN